MRTLDHAPRDKADVDKNDKSVKNLVMLLFETGLLASGPREPPPCTLLASSRIKLELGIAVEDAVGREGGGRRGAPRPLIVPRVGGGRHVQDEVD